MDSTLFIRLASNSDAVRISVAGAAPETASKQRSISDRDSSDFKSKVIEAGRRL
jgi:hypothetical protein